MSLLRKSVIFSLFVVIFAAQACAPLNSIFNPYPTHTPSPLDTMLPKGPRVADLPVPLNFYNYIGAGNDAISYSVSMPLADLMKFYRDEFAKIKLKERADAAVITDTSFSLTWDGHPSDKAVLVEAQDAGQNVINVTVRFVEP